MPRAPRAHASAVLWSYVPKLVLRNFTNSRATSKSNYDGFRILSRVNFSTSAPLGALVLLVTLDPCKFVCLYVKLAYEQLRSNFKVELWWLLIIQLTQFFCVTPCVSPLRGWHCSMCPTCTWVHARAILWRHVPKLTQSNWRYSGATSKWNYDGFQWPNWLNFFVWLRVCLLYMVDNLPRALRSFIGGVWHKGVAYWPWPVQFLKFQIQYPTTYWGHRQGHGLKI